MANKEKEYNERSCQHEPVMNWMGEKYNFFGSNIETMTGGQDKNNQLSEETTALKQLVKELENELAKSKKEHEATVKGIIENNQKLIQSSRSQYEREIDHLKEQLEEAYIQIKNNQKLKVLHKTEE